MYAYCEKRDYSTKDFDTMEEIKTKVEQDGGSLHLSPIVGYTGMCPNCKGELRID